MNDLPGSGEPLAGDVFEGAPVKPAAASIATGVITKIYPTRVWIESSAMGDRIVVLQHEGCDPFDYATFGYDYRYTSNSGTWNAATKLALELGATEPVEHRQRALNLKVPTEDELREQIKMLQEMLSDSPENRAFRAIFHKP